MILAVIPGKSSVREMPMPKSQGLEGASATEMRNWFVNDAPTMKQSYANVYLYLPSKKLESLTGTRIRENERRAEQWM